MRSDRRRRHSRWIDDRLPVACLALAWCALACGGQAGGGADAGATGGVSAGTGGHDGAGGTIGSGGSPASGGSPGSGGKPGTGGTGGATGSGGGLGSGGTGGNPAGGAGRGGVVGGGGGTTGAAGSTGTGGAASGGAAGAHPSGSGGRAGGAGGTTGSGAAGGNAMTGGVPPGYPTPTPANRMTCKAVALTTSTNGDPYCPGGGTGPNCIECLFGGDAYQSTNSATAQGTSEAGNYLVTVVLGGDAAGTTEIAAEANRRLLAAVTTTAGQSATYTFVVNVRAKEGQPTEDVAAGYPGLDLFFSGPSASPPQVSAVGYALAGTTKPVMVYIAGDSTVCDQTDLDYAGWGQLLPQFFAPPADIANYADSGESSASFLASGAEWGAVKAAMTSGDFVLIQFGHNDKTTTSADFQSNIAKMVSDARAKGVTPILLSSPARATFSGQTLTDQSSLHTADMQAVATAQKVEYIDLTAITTTWYNQLGPGGWKAYHALNTDATHTNRAGANAIAGFVADAIRTQRLSLAPYLRAP